MDTAVEPGPGDVGFCNRQHPLPEIGDRFGEIEIVDVFGIGPKGRSEIWAKCLGPVCKGKNPKYRIHEQNLSHSKSCKKCYHALYKDVIRERRLTRYGYAAICPDEKIRASLMRRISHAIGRCTNPDHHAWEQYGCRGIRVYEAWVPIPKGRRKFLKYLVTLPGHDDATLQLDRIDNDGNYEPGNLRFVTPHVNMCNRRSVLEMQNRIDELEREVEELRARYEHKER